MLRRLLKHLASPAWWARRAFRAADLAAIGEVVKASEILHRGEIRVVIEGSLPLRALLAQQSCRDRAAMLFRSLGIAATREESGVLVYIQLVDRRVEILADRGIAGLVHQNAWDAICRRLEAAFATGDFREGTLQAIEHITALLVRHFPATGNNPNELEDTPTLL